MAANDREEAPRRLGRAWETNAKNKMWHIRCHYTKERTRARLGRKCWAVANLDID
jgi:hypothetical protein